MNLSREFRALVRSIRAPLEDEIAERAAPPAVRRERLKIVHRDTMRLFQLVNTLFDLSGDDPARRPGSQLVDLSAQTVIIPMLRGAEAALERPAAGRGVPTEGLRRRPDATVAPERPPRILVVDDSEDGRAVARVALEHQGYTVAVASGGAEALAAFDREAPDCVLLAVELPDLDGAAVCEQIRARPGGADTPVVFLTAQRDLDGFERALRVGGNDFLARPVRPAELVVRVRCMLALRHRRDDLREHYELLKKQRDDLMRLQLQKERTMAFVVHDLKNPVVAVDLVTQLLSQLELAPEARELVSEIRSQAARMNRMIMNLLDLARADEGRLVARRAEIPATDLVDGTLSELAVQAASRGVTLASRVEVECLRGDRDLLHRLLANLIENAIHHAPADTTVKVSVVPTAHGTELRVADRGSGVPEAMREKIFSAFVQLEDPRAGAARAGRGLGLAFCRAAAVCHGGSIRVEDGAPGAAFCVELPHGG